MAKIQRTSGNQSNQSIEDIDDYYNAFKVKKQKNSRVVNPADDEIYEIKKPVTKKERSPELPSLSNSLTSSARSRLRMYIQRTPQYKDIDDAINTLKGLLVTYKKLGNDKLYGETVDHLNKLSQGKKEYVRKYHEGDKFDNDKESFYGKIKKDTIYKELLDQQRNLELQRRSKNPDSLYQLLYELRKSAAYESFNGNDDEIEKFESLSTIDDEFNEVILDDDNEVILESDEVYGEIDAATLMDMLVNNRKNVPFQEKYYALCKYIANILNESVDEVFRMPTKQIKDDLKRTLPSVDPISKQLKSVQLELNKRRSEISGVEDITKLMFDIFDYDTVPEAEPKEFLAAGYVDNVKAIAFNCCRRMGMEHSFDDALGYGLLGLAKAINVWYDNQKLMATGPNKQANPFGGLMFLTVSNLIKRGLYHLNSGGMVTGSSAATHENKLRKRIDSFIAENPDYIHVSKDIIETLIDTTDIFNPNKITNESQYTALVGGSENGEDSDIWANANEGGFNSAEISDEYKQLLVGFQQLFNLCETKTNAKGLSREVKLFDNIDFVIIKLMFGFEFDGNKEAKYRAYKNKKIYEQKEIVNKVCEMLSTGELKHSGGKTEISQPAISTRCKNVEKKLKMAVTKFPELSKSLQFMSQNLLMNSDILATLSNEREDSDFEFSFNNNNDRLDEVIELPTVEFDMSAIDNMGIADGYEELIAGSVYE